MTTKLNLSIILALLMSCILLNARPVNKTITLRQPDGSGIVATIVGDEYYHTVRDLQGNPLAKGADGWWRIAAREAAASPYSRKRRMEFESKALPSGTALASRKHCAILLVDFPDLKMEATREDFIRMVTEKGYSEGGAIGSVNDYFNDQFRGDIKFSYEISPVITLKNPMADYFGNDKDGKDKNAAAAVAEACQKAAELGFDFSMCDDDNDGEVDNVFLFVAGKDEADGGGDECVWSHMHYLEFSQFKGLALCGKIINNYAISTEKRLCSDGSFSFTSIGTFCHEYSHAIGLKDMYDTDYAGSGGQGNGLWSTTGLMDGGNMNADCAIPPYYSSVDFDSVGLGNPEALVCGDYELEPISRNRRFLKLECPNPGEYYLIECRSREKWDREIGGCGLLIYHIDKSGNDAGHSDWLSRNVTARERWAGNEVNCRPDRQCAKLVSATPGLSAYDTRGRFRWNTSGVFFPSDDNRSFTPVSDPAFVFWDGSEAPLALTDIRFNGDNVCFKVIANSNLRIPEVSPKGVDIFQDAAIVSWEADKSSFEGHAYAYLCREDGRVLREVQVTPYAKGTYALVLEDLEANTSYTLAVSFDRHATAKDGTPIKFKTKAMYDAFPFIYLNNVERNEDGSFKYGSRIPLRVFNAKGATGVRWYLNRFGIGTGPDGYYHVDSPGILKAVITYSDGSSDTITKEIIVK